MKTGDFLMKIRTRALFPAVLLITYAFSSCSSTNGTKDLSLSNNAVTYNAITQNAVTQNTISKSEVTNSVTQKNTKVTSVVYNGDVLSAFNGTEDVSDNTENNSGFYGLSGYYLFSTGAGDWRTELRIGEDGSYSAIYSDGNYISDGTYDENGNNGTEYLTEYCAFDGKFDIYTVDDLTVTMTVRNVSCHDDPSFEYHSESKAYYREIPFGFEDTDLITVYKKGTKIADIPPTCLEWIGMSLSWGKNIPAVLDHDVLYNPAVQSTFIKTEEEQ